VGRPNALGAKPHTSAGVEEMKALGRRHERQRVACCNALAAGQTTVSCNLACTRFRSSHALAAPLMRTSESGH
jgi:hypothetical protein